MTRRPQRSPKSSRLTRENLDNSINHYQINTSDSSESNQSSSPSPSDIESLSKPSPPTMAPLSTSQRETLAAEKAEERLQQLHEKDLRIRRSEFKDRKADRERRILQE